jgi:hypothetical protein
MPFKLTEKVLDAWYPPEEFYIFIIYAPLGFGKSAYSFKCGVEILQHVYKLGEEEAWEKLKQFIVFHPSQFFQKIEQIEQAGLKRIPFIIWEDAGLWLYAMEWNNPFIEAFIKYLNVARTHLAALICSSPSPEWVIRKLRRFPSAFTVRILKYSGDKEGFVHTWQRIARGYRFWIHPDLRHTGVEKAWEDTFICKMPNKFYDWYKPIRDTYENMALNLMKEKWVELSGKAKSILIEDYPQLNMPALTKVYHT